MKASAGTTSVGSVQLANPVLTASGTAGHGVEMAEYLDLSSLGAVVVKSLAAFAWGGNPPPRLHGVRGGMVNAVGLQGPGVRAWKADGMLRLLDVGATVVASIWGRSVHEYAAAAELLSDTPRGVVAVEVNLSCPNLEGRGSMFAHDAAESARVITAAAAAAGRPVWAKLSANTHSIVDVAGAVAEAGAEAVTCINTMLAMAFDPVTRRPVLFAGGGGLSGPAIHPIAVRAVHDVRAAHPDLAIIGVGGVQTGWDAEEFLLAGADAVQVGTASFADPAAAARVLAELREHRHHT